MPKTKTKKAAVRKDNSAAIARTAARKARNIAANAMAHLRNEELAERMGIKPGHGKDRASVAIRRITRPVTNTAGDTPGDA